MLSFVLQTKEKLSLSFRMPKVRWLHKTDTLFGYKYKVHKNRNKKGKTILGLLIPNAVDFKRGSGMDPALNMEKWLP